MLVVATSGTPTPGLKGGPITARTRRLLLTTTALFCLAATTLAGASGAAAAAPDAPDTTSLIEVGDQAFVRPNTIVDNVYVVGADAVIAGLVRKDVVVVGGDVLLLPTALVQENVVCIGGRVLRQRGAVVVGDTVAMRGSTLASLTRWSYMRPVTDPFSTDSMAGWALSSLVYIILAAVVATAAPRHTDLVARRVVTRFWPSLAWGLLTALVIAPVVSVVLFVTVIGIALLIPWLLVALPVALILGFTGASAALGSRLLRAAGRPGVHRVAAAALGALVLGLAWLVPYAGMGVWVIAWVVGLGAVAAAVWRWLHDRRARRRSPAGATTTPP